MQQVHMVRMNPRGETRVLEDALNRGYASVGWGAVGDVSGLEYTTVRDEIADMYELEGRSISPPLSAVWHICNDIAIGDYILTPDGYGIHLGKVTSTYYYCDGKNEPKWMNTEDTAHRVNVHWFDFEINRDDISEELRASLRNQRTYSNLTYYVEEIRSLVEPSAYAEITDISLTAKIKLNNSTIVTFSGLPRNLDNNSLDVLCEELKKVYGR